MNRGFGMDPVAKRRAFLAWVALLLGFILFAITNVNLMAFAPKSKTPRWAGQFTGNRTMLRAQASHGNPRLPRLRPMAATNVSGAGITVDRSRSPASTFAPTGPRPMPVAPKRTTFIDASTEITHTGDLIITGTQVFTIENTTYNQYGNVYVQDGGKLLIRNATLNFIQDYHDQNKIYLLDQASLEVTDSSIDSPYLHLLWAQDTAAITLINSTAASAEIRVFDNASFHAIGCQICQMLGGAGDHWPYEPTDYSTLVLEDSSIGSIGLYFDVWSGGTLGGIRRGLFSDWESSQGQ